MDEAFIYLIKVNIALVVFYLFYRLLFSPVSYTHLTLPTILRV